jgi:hypothetical protein
MVNIAHIAHELGLKKTRSGYLGSCPVCEYNNAFNLSQHNGRLLTHCFAAGCSFESIIYALAIRRILPTDYLPAGEKSNPNFAPSAAVGTHPSRSKNNQNLYLQLWQESLPLPGTLAEEYLKSRGINGFASPTLRYLSSAYHSPSRNKLPALIARIDRLGCTEPVGVHRTFLKLDGIGKADVPQNKMMLGQVQGGSVHLAEPTDQLAVTEGIETGFRHSHLGCVIDRWHD